MEGKDKAVVISSFAEDRILSSTGKSVREGGPALFITGALDMIGTPYSLVTGSKGVVEIDNREGKELGRVLKAGRIPDPACRPDTLVIVSTLLDEFDMDSAWGFSCLDLQGFVRDGSVPGGKRRFDSPALGNYKVIKGTEEEFACVQSMRIEKVPVKLITKGAQGFTVIDRGVRREYPTEMIAVDDAIGAGDTLFTAFCVKYYETGDSQASAEFAKGIVTRFLKGKMEGSAMRKVQVGVMGSAADAGYSESVESAALEIGKRIASAGAVTVYGAEKDYDSLSTAAARGAKSAGGTTVGVTYGKGMDIFDRDVTDITISCGMERGGGREFVLVNSCDVIIALSGGSGTLTEMAIAYQSGIPIVCLKGMGGWSDRLAGSFIDSRERLRCVEAGSPEEAVRLALSLARARKMKDMK